MWRNAAEFIVGGFLYSFGYMLVFIFSNRGKRK